MLLSAEQFYNFFICDSVAKNSIVTYRRDNDVKDVLESLASICASKPDHDVAVSLAVTDTQCVVYVALNDTAHEGLEIFLRDLWRILRAMSRTSQRSSPEAALLRNKVFEMVFQFGLARLKDRVTRRYDTFAAISTVASDIFSDIDPDDDGKAFLKVKDALQSIRDELERESLNAVALRVRVFELVLLVDPLLKKGRIDRLFHKIGHESDTDEVKQYLGNCILYADRIGRLCLCAYRPQLAKVFESDITIYFTDTPPPVPLEPLDLSEEQWISTLRDLVVPEDVRQELEDASWQATIANEAMKAERAASNTQVNARMHSQCVLLVHHHDRLGRRHENISANAFPFPYIGTSEQPCFGCNAFFETYRELTESTSPLQFHPPGIQINKTPWITPRFGDDVVNASMEEAFMGKLRGAFSEYLKENVEKGHQPQKDYTRHRGVLDLAMGGFRSRLSRTSNGGNYANSLLE